MSHLDRRGLIRAIFFSLGFGSSLISLSVLLSAMTKLSTTFIVPPPAGPTVLGEWQKRCVAGFQITPVPLPLSSRYSLNHCPSCVQTVIFVPRHQQSPFLFELYVFFAFFFQEPVTTHSTFLSPRFFLRVSDFCSLFLLRFSPPADTCHPLIRLMWF